MNEHECKGCDVLFIPNRFDNIIFCKKCATELMIKDAQRVLKQEEFNRICEEIKKKEKKNE